MCLAVPLKIIDIDGNNATGDSCGIKRDIRIDFVKNVSVGDYVIVHAGFAIERLDKKQAEENIKAIMEVEDAIRDI